MNSVVSMSWFRIRKKNERFEFRGIPQSIAYSEPTTLDK